jgi:hypothetical protein
MRICVSINTLAQLRCCLQDHRHHQRLYTQTLIARQPLNRAIHSTRQSPTRSEQHHPSRDVSSRQIHTGVPDTYGFNGIDTSQSGRQFTQLGAQPCAHPVAGMRITPAHRLPRPPPPDPAAQPRSGRLLANAPANHPDGQGRTRCSPRHRRHRAAGRYLLPGDASTDDGDGLSLTQQRRRRLLARSRRRYRCCRWFRRRGWLRRRRSHPAVASGVSRC